ncbi:hypothetical protein PanWU01x14_136470 [Parasponia andersonii]|uniref:Uncharacterized protein n=1 Tax=Parasponia andersonii TaxID=3476 RepID=A0A2P5CNZ2_PARAD|nr:hypothetical protein PanWU01x14_136470 [Parasponia andersonii]
MEKEFRWKVVNFETIRAFKSLWAPRPSLFCPITEPNPTIEDLRVSELITEGKNGLDSSFRNLVSCDVTEAVWEESRFWDLIFGFRGDAWNINIDASDVKRCSHVGLGLVVRDHFEFSVAAIVVAKRLVGSF